MEAKLVIVGGKANKRDVRLKLPTVIGRSREADLTVAHPMISRRHCQLLEADGMLKLKDLGSLNGTLVDGERIEGEVALRPDEEFTVGPLTFRVEYEYSGEVAAAPPDEGAGDETPDFAAVDLVEDSSPVESAEEQEALTAPAGVPEVEMPDFESWGAPRTASPEEDESDAADEAVPPILFEEESPAPADDTEAQPEPAGSGTEEADEFGFELSEEAAVGAAAQSDPSPWAETVAPGPPPQKGKAASAGAPQNGQPAKAAKKEPPPDLTPPTVAGAAEDDEQELAADLDDAEDAALKDFLKGLQ